MLSRGGSKAVFHVKEGQREIEKPQRRGSQGGAEKMGSGSALRNWSQQDNLGRSTRAKETKRGGDRLKVQHLHRGKHIKERETKNKNET